MNLSRFAAIVPIGPDAADERRAVDLLEGLLHWEPAIAACVILDGAPSPRVPSALTAFASPTSCRTMTLHAARIAGGGSPNGAVTAGVVEAIAWIHANADVDFALAIETDALVIDTFSDRVAAFLAAHPDAGVIGTVGQSSSPDVRAVWDSDAEPWLVRSQRLLPPMPDEEMVPAAPAHVDGIGWIPVETRRAFDAIRPHIIHAMRRGYVSNEYCQAGAFIVSRLMMARMVDCGYVARPHVWRALPYPIDLVMAMYARAVELRICDYSAEGEPFALQCKGLPFDLETLVSRRHCVIHSVEDDLRSSEAEIRAYFRAQRSQTSRLSAARVPEPAFPRASIALTSTSISTSTSPRIPASVKRPASSGTRFAAIIPVGSTDLDVTRTSDLLDSLIAWEPGIRWCIFIEDRPGPSDLPARLSSSSACHAFSIRNPRGDRPGLWATGVNAGILTALAWIQRETDAEFVLRIDNDALVIGPFADAVSRFVACTPEAGVVGAVNGSCNLTVRALFDASAEPHLLRLRRLLPTDDDVSVAHIGLISRRAHEAFEQIRSHVDDAVAHGYASNHHCQGGACAISRAMIDRMAEAGYVAQADTWVDVPVLDDMALAMYAHAVDLRPVDCSAPGLPFGVQFKGLAHPPEELIARGYGIIHSVKGDRRYPEADIRGFFRARRVMSTR